MQSRQSRSSGQWMFRNLFTAVVGRIFSEVSTDDIPDFLYDSVLVLPVEELGVVLLVFCTLELQWK